MKAQCTTTSIQLCTHWEAVLADWVDFLLRKFILGSERPSTPAGLNVFECSITALSAILDFPDRDAQIIKNVSPNLQYLVTQAWYFLIDIQHANWGPWSCALVSLAHSDPYAYALPTATDPNLPVLYKENAQLGNILLKHLITRIQRLRTMMKEEFSFFKAYVMLLTTEPRCFRGPNPLYLRNYIRGTLAALLDMVSILLPLKRKTLLTCSIHDQEFKDAHDLVLLSVMTLDRHMHDPVRVQQVLESGFVKSVLLADERYFEMDEKHKTNVEGRFAEWAAKVIDNMARYSVYPLVLRQFIRYSRRDEVKPGNLVEKGSTSLWKSWKNAVGKSALLYDLWQTSKEKGLCSHSQCPLEGKSPEECLSVRYRRCLDCKSVIYCSLACRKAHWKEEHRAICNEIAAMRMRGRSPMTRHDLDTFGMLLKRYFHTHVETFDYLVKKYRSSIAPQHLEPSIRDRRRHPIAFIDFNVPEIPSVELAELLHPSSLSGRIQERYRWESGWTETLLKTWEDTDANQLLVLAAFARSQFSSWPYAIVIDFPVSGEDEQEPPGEVETSTLEGARKGVEKVRLCTD
ncbi:hypothetical protein PM082_018473 [Marasmius tenuissimus]|nr:hypothetical protein PM082_018473 [Marasmius tenuissimus]